MAARTSRRQWAEFDDLIRRGYQIKEAARRVGVSENTAYVHRARQKPEDRVFEEIQGSTRTVRVGANERIVKLDDTVGPIPYDDLSDNAKRAWNDFGFFQERYFGRLATPWQIEAAEEVVELLGSSEKEYVCENAPPGCGKSTTFTHDIPAWITVRNRAIRGQIGSKVQSSAERYIARLKNSLTATLPIQPEDSEIQLGLAIPAVATLADDFGVFRPPTKEDVWSQQAIVVAQHGGQLSAQKEPTWSAFGMDSGFLGMRYDLIIWDDLVDQQNTRSSEARQKLREWWDSIAEKRLEPNGVLILQGQRMGADDLYRYVLDKHGYTEEDDEGDDPDWQPATDETAPRKYRHIVYKAHYDDRCKNEHKKTSPYYPEGCLLDPRRLTWRELQIEKRNVKNNFEVVYQQQDVDPENALINMAWIKGGVDPKTGEHYPGCLDRERGTCEIPNNLTGRLVSLATADPSPTNFWSIQWWVVRVDNGEAQERYLMDHIRRRLDAPAFLDWINNTQSYVGVMEDWQERSAALHLPITAWIVEKNGAQRYLLQYEHVKRWMAHHRVRVIPHNTDTNKSDEEFGVQTLKNIYRYGMARLPYRPGSGFSAATQLIEELTTWPDGRTDDCVMANWFLEWNLPKLLPASVTLPKMKRPSWLQSAHTWSWREEKVNS